MGRALTRGTLSLPLQLLRSSAPASHRARGEGAATSRGCPHSPWPTTSPRSLSHPPRATSTAGADGGSWLHTPLKWKGHGGRKRGGGPPDKVSGAPAALLGAGRKPEATQGRSRSAKARRRLLGGLGRPPRSHPMGTGQGSTGRRRQARQSFAERPPKRPWARDGFRRHHSHHLEWHPHGGTHWR